MNHSASPAWEDLTLDHLGKYSIVSDLTSLTLIDVTGDDAQSFLQGQLSNDVAGINQLRSQLNAYCNPKGRMLALIRLVRHTGGFWIIVPVGLADKLVSRLRMYVMRAKVNIEPMPETTLLGQINGTAVNENFVEGKNTGDKNEIHCIPIEGVIPRQILIGEKNTVSAFIQSKGFKHASSDRLWRLIDIRSGIPQVYPKTAEEFIPQMINLDLVDGVNFTKGCYPGQEIVARLRYLGKLKQRMLAGTVSDVETLQPGDPIYSDQRADQKVGLVVDAVEIRRSEYTFSATAPTNMIENGTLLVGSSSGPALTRISLPYALSIEQ